jgi:adenylate cyclase
MADIFISYSRKDSEQALELAERLRAGGTDVWIDQHGIVGAEQWATEIVEGIRACSTFLILLSPNSIESENVLRELSLASEKRKRVLPVDIEPTVLPSSFEYALAGLQRVAISDFDRILHAHKHGVDKVIRKDERKSLMILPFEDHSPTQDNEWLANGIVSELISALSNVKALRISDNQATKEFKKYNGQLATYAKEMNIRYFVQGDVRKFGDNIKITSRLLDIETGDHLWQDSMKGKMNDIFDIQEKVAEKVVEGLKVHLASDEKKKLAEPLVRVGTENAEAYELFLKAQEYFALNTKQGFQLAIQLFSEAIKLDPGYANAYSSEANALAGLFRSYNPDPTLLDEGLHLIEEAILLKPDLWGAYGPLSLILQLQGKLEEAERTAKEYVHNAPEIHDSHFALGFFYDNTRQYAKAIAAYEQALKLKPERLPTLYNIVICCEKSGEEEKCRHWSEAAIPHFQRHLKLFPGDEYGQVDHAVLLHFAGRDDEAREAANRLKNLNDGGALYDTACLQRVLEDYEATLKTFRKSIEAGYRNMPNIEEFLNNEEDEGFVKLKGTPEWEEVREMVEKMSEPLSEP